MKRNIIGIYALAVCFVTVVCAVIATGIGIYDLLQIANPEFTLPSWQYERHQTNEAFFPGDAERVNLSEEEMTERRLASYETAIKAERRGAQQSLIKVFIVLILDALVFAVHWRLAQRSQKELE